MSSNVQGKRLALAHLIFNMVTAIIAIAFIFQLVTAVDIFSAFLGIAEDNYTLKLAVFHTIFNTIGIVAMLPFMSKLVNFLMRVMPEKVYKKAEPKHLSDSSMDISDVAVDAVRKETVHLYDNAYEIIAHGLSLHRHDIESEKDLETLALDKGKPMDINIQEEYELGVKGLYGEIVAFISKAHPIMTPEQANDLFRVRAVGRDIVEAIKSTKHLHDNLNLYITSDNQYIQAEYNIIRIGLASVLRRLDVLRKSPGDVTDTIPLEAVSDEMQEHDREVHERLHQLIREDKITVAMATSLMNDATFAYNVASNLVRMGIVLFAGEECELGIGGDDLCLPAESGA